VPVRLRVFPPHVVPRTPETRNSISKGNGEADKLAVAAATAANV
jgi:hypothetical protein